MRQALQAEERVLPVLRHLRRAGEQALALVDVERGEARRGGGRVPRIGVAVEELDQVLGAVHEGLVDLLLHEHRAHRHDAVGERPWRWS